MTGIYSGFLTLTKPYFDFIIPVKKSSCISDEPRSLDLATIYERYSPAVWLHIYTDGSDKVAIRNAGAGDFSVAFEVKEPVAFGQIILMDN